MLNFSSFSSSAETVRACGKTTGKAGGQAGSQEFSLRSEAGRGGLLRPERWTSRQAVEPEIQLGPGYKKETTEPELVIF